MSEQSQKTAERLNNLLDKINDTGKERLLDFGNGYIRGFRDGRAPVEQASSDEAADVGAST